ncbi:piercer of microtubule wall 1 protein-like [Engraulis encrasicolus]|uniref:piercer of microtubule wall 1 protein-like n=1 Tax=Engraulis encrasicolus TaxID=184585 RepID=UPI002FD411F9
MDEDMQEVEHNSLKTGDVYKVDKDLPKRFNNPDCFQGYSKRVIHPLYQTSNQIYGSRKPTVHEMPVIFNGSYRKFSEHLLKTGMYRDSSFNTSLDKSIVSRPCTIAMLHDPPRSHFYPPDGKE